MHLPVQALPCAPSLLQSPSESAIAAQVFGRRASTALPGNAYLVGVELTANKDASGGYTGLTLYKINFKNAANTFTSFLTNANTAARTYTFQNRNGTIADDTDLATKAALAGSSSQAFSVSTLTAATSIASGTGNGATAGLKFINGSSGFASSYGAIYPENATPSATNFSFAARYNSSQTFINADTAGQVYQMIAGNIITTVTATGMAITGIVTPEADNTRTLGTGVLRWSTVYAGTGAINTSDAREKTEVRSLTESEIEAAKQLSKEIGAYQWLESIKAKGNGAREHIGVTVQRAIEIMRENGLDPFNYGFICYDKWDRVTVEHPATDAVEAKAASPAIYETFLKNETIIIDGTEVDMQRKVLREISPAIQAIEAIEAKEAWIEIKQEAGDRYAFRYDELNLFIARGIESRLAALEGNKA